MRPLSYLLALAVIAAACTKSHPSATEPPTSGSPPPSTKVASVTITPTTATIAVGETSQLSGVPRDLSGKVSGATQILWSTANAAVVSTTQNGLITGVGVGTAAVYMSADGSIGQCMVTVTKAP